MRVASSHFTEDDRRRIAQAIAEAESGAAAEIVPVVATDSGRYDRAEDLVGLLTGIGVMVIAWLLFQREDPSAGGWDGLRLAIGLPVLVILVLVGFVAGVLIAMQVGWLRRLFTPGQEMRDEVHRCATELFFDRRIHHTPDASGMLVYLSLLERRAVILTDERVRERLDQPAIDELCKGLTEAVRSGHLTGALCAMISRAGEQLREAGADAGAETETGDENVMRDALITLD